MSKLASASRGKIPDWLRWLAAVWLVVWFPVYWYAWSLANFLHLCDVAVILTCIGLWTGNALLLSSQAVSSVVIDTLWALDVATWLLFRRQAHSAGLICPRWIGPEKQSPARQTSSPQKGSA